MAFLDKPGTMLPVEKVVEVQALPRIKAIKIIIDQIGRGLYPQENEWIQTTYGATVPENEIETIVSRLTGAGAQLAHPQTMTIQGLGAGAVALRRAGNE